MNKLDFVFVGNRRFVLQRMIENGIYPKLILIIKNSHLERDFAQGIIKLENVELIPNKYILLDILKKSDFDIFLSNGCPYILPISDLQKACYVNIHPSFLPDLRGKDPVIGSILKKRSAGATAHLMDEGIDTGAIIDQIEIPWTPDLDVTTLYQLSFLAEKEVFDLALKRNFKAKKKQSTEQNIISYSRSIQDQTISFTEPNEIIIQKIRAFNNTSIGCSFYIDGNKFKVFSAQIMTNPYLEKNLMRFKECVVGMYYENSFIFHKDGQVIRFYNITCPPGSELAIGTNLRSI